MSSHGTFLFDDGDGDADDEDRLPPPVEVDEGETFFDKDEITSFVHSSVPTESNKASSSPSKLVHRISSIEDPTTLPRSRSNSYDPQIHQLHQNQDYPDLKSTQQQQSQKQEQQTQHQQNQKSHPQQQTDATKRASSQPLLLSNPVYQALYDFGCGIFVALMVGAKIFTFSILVFQASTITSLRSSAMSASAIGVLILSVILLMTSRYPYVVIVPDMFPAPYIIQMSYTLSNVINNDPDALNATFLALIFIVAFVSGIFHVLMSYFKILRFAEFLPYPVFCGLFSAVGLTIVQRSILFAPNYQIIPSMAVAISLSLKIIKQKETRPAVTFITVVVTSVIVFYAYAASQNYSIDDLRNFGWLVHTMKEDKNFGIHLVPWLLWTEGSAHVDFTKIQWTTLVFETGTPICLLIILIALRRSMQFANLNRLFSARASPNRELSIHGISQASLVLGLGTFGGIFSGPDMVRIKRMHGGEVFPGIISVIVVGFFALVQFKGIDYIPKFVFTGILASEGFMMLDRFLLMPYRLAGPVEWFAVAIIAVTSFFDIFKGFFLGAAISLFLYSMRFYRTGCVKLTGTGLTIRSTVDRDERAADWLSSHGEKIRVIQLRGTVAFANANSVLDVVADMLEMNGDKAHPERSPQGRFILWTKTLFRKIRAIYSEYRGLSGGGGVNINGGRRSFELNPLGDEEDTEFSSSTVGSLSSEWDRRPYFSASEMSVGSKGEGNRTSLKGNSGGGGALNIPVTAPSSTIKGKIPPRPRIALEDMFSPPNEAEKAAASQSPEPSPRSRAVMPSAATSSPPTTSATHAVAPSPSTCDPELGGIPSPEPKRTRNLFSALGYGEKNETVEKNQYSSSSLPHSLLSSSDTMPSRPQSLLSTAPPRSPLQTPSEPPRDPNNDFFRPEFLVIDMALVVGVDPSALDTFKMIAEYCAKASPKVELCLSGGEPHLDLLINAGVFLKSNRFPDLDAALTSCEDRLLARYQIEESLSGLTMGTEGEVGEGAGGDVGEYTPKKGFEKCLLLAQERHGLDDSFYRTLLLLAPHVQPLLLHAGDVIMDSAQGSPVDDDKDGLFFIESGSIAVHRDPQQSTAALTLRSRRRKRMSSDPRILRLQHRTFQLSRLGPGYILGATELCSRYRSMGAFVVTSPHCRAHFLPFRSILELESSQPLLTLRVYQLASKVVADGYDRSKEQLSHLVDTIYSPPMKVSTATEKLMKRMRFGGWVNEKHD